ncbi:MAG: DNA repair protein RadA [Phycisphaerales bacterium]
MAKRRKVFACYACGSVQSRWLGKCPDCGTWDSLEEQTLDDSAAKDPQRGLVEAWADLNDGATPDASTNPAKPLDDLASATTNAPRLNSSIAELDRVLGGGLVPASIVLVGGEPGIGKSTLLLQAAAAWGRAGHTTLYVSSEESAEQVSLRAARFSSKANPGVLVLADTNLARIVEQVRKAKPRVVVIDSIQMVYKADLPAAPGSVSQLRRCAAELAYLAKASGIAVVLVGHVTKDGTLAGPRLLEHLVDAVVSFEGDRYHAHRVVRCLKNRFGTTLEVGLFEMSTTGLRELPEGAAGRVLAASDTPRPGSVVSPAMTGSRCVLVEVQALTATGFLGAAKRKCSGLDPNRLAMLIAVLEQHAGLRLADRDIFASSVGGLRVIEPAADLALLLAIAGSHYKKALPKATAVFGEVGLGGEIRPVPHAEARLREALRLGFKNIIAPKGVEPIPGVTLHAIKNVDQAVALLE